MDELILEGLLTTIDANGAPFLSPMGPRVDRDLTRFVLRPFVTSGTYARLRASGQAVFHITDDVELLARAAIHRLESLPAYATARVVAGHVLTDACRWWELEVVEHEPEEPRATLYCRVVTAGRGRDFLGFSRAKHAVLEAAVLATRVHVLDGTSIAAELARLGVIVGKTAGDQERRAFELLRAYCEEAGRSRVG